MRFPSFAFVSHPLYLTCENQATHSHYAKKHSLPGNLKVPGFDAKFDISRFLLAYGIYVCRPCHSAVHRCSDNRELAEERNSLERIMADSKMAAWAAFNGAQRVRVGERHKETRKGRKAGEEEERARGRREAREDEELEVVELKESEKGAEEEVEVSVGSLELSVSGKEKKAKRVGKRAGKKAAAAAAAAEKAAVAEAEAEAETGHHSVHENGEESGNH